MPELVFAGNGEVSQISALDKPPEGVIYLPPYWATEGTMKRFILAVGVLFLTTSLHAEEDAAYWKKSAESVVKAVNIIKENYQNCHNMTDTKKRLECYDLNTEALSGPAKVGTSPEAPPKAASPAIEYKVVDAADIFVSTNKYMNRPIELRNAKCFYADVNEFRCLGADRTVLLIVSPDITPAAEKKALQDDCDSVKNISSRKCRKTLRFIPVTADEDTISGYQKRKTIVTRSIEIVPQEGSSTGRRR